MKPIGNQWDALLSPEFEKPYYQNLRQFLISEYKSHVIYPNMYDIYNALATTDYSQVKVVILGQDPYHEPGQAHGLAFSVQPGCQPPPSLQNIDKELQAEFGIPIPQSGDLTAWAKQGVLLLNTCLTVRQHMANSHKGKGWEQLTDAIIKMLDQREEPLVFMLWGANARSKAELIHNSKHLVLQAPHPSPLSAHRGFFGCGHFQKANAFLIQTGQAPIDWKR